ncbi:MAG: methylenetetrahydrofolate reductase [Actinobacteria bacterium]|nr:methylenetetrahydrofolate reductase [Actinomycetota bacterium]MBU1944980.1 methylenetetrahydrofolate reductase [Actinomycetota bacterium]MBU2688461.1 methylenetetrahydrofolate reductase [Actinomycetota bacterium]
MKAGTNLEKVLEADQFAVTAEIGPPKGGSSKAIETKGEAIRHAADAFNVTDNQTAVVRMSSLAACGILKRMGLDPVMQMLCRDRNRIMLQSDICGAVALGIGNLLCLTGDHVKFGNHPEAKVVFDIDSVQLIAAVKTMREEGKFISGEEVAGPVPMFIGAVENPYADPFEYRTARLSKKVKAGADFIQTQAVYDVPRFAEWMKEICAEGIDRRTHILAGIIPVKAVGMARYMRDYVSGVEIPDAMIKRLEKAKDVREEGIKVILEIIEEVKVIPGVHGIHVQAVGWEEIVPEIIERAGLLPRPAL